MSYIWRTMEDDRVRPEHAARNGLVFDDNYRPEPGEEYNCRCIRETDPEADDEDTGAAPNPSTNPTVTFGTSFAKSMGINAAISLSTSMVLGKAAMVLPGPAKLIVPILTIGYGIATGESASNIAAQVLGGLVGAKVGKSLAKVLFTELSAGAVFSPVATNEALLTKISKLNIKSKVPDTVLQGNRLSALSDAFRGERVNIQPVPQGIKNLFKTVKQTEKARIKQGPFQQNKIKGLAQLSKKLNGKVF